MSRISQTIVSANILAEKMVDEALFPDNCEFAYVGDFNLANGTVALNYVMKAGALGGELRTIDVPQAEFDKALANMMNNETCEDLVTE